jgi:hypothetical protein
VGIVGVAVNHEHKRFNAALFNTWFSLNHLHLIHRFKTPQPLRRRAPTRCLACIGVMLILCSSAPPAFAQSNESTEGLPKLELVCNESVPYSQELHTVERTGLITLRQRPSNLRTKDYILMDRKGCFIAFEGTDFSVRGLNQVLTLDVSVFEVNGPYSYALARYQEEIGSRIHEACGNAAENPASTSSSVYIDCEIRVISRFLGRGQLWQIDAIDNPIFDTLFIVSFDGVLIGGEYTEFTINSAKSIKSFSF